MSDYLASLLARYQPELPVITPRLPSLFEPDQPTIGSVPAWEGGIQDQKSLLQKSEAGKEIPLIPPFAKGEAEQHAVSQHQSKVMDVIVSGNSATVVPTPPVPTQPPLPPMTVPRIPVSSSLQVAKTQPVYRDDTNKPTVRPAHRQQNTPAAIHQPLVRSVIPDTPVIPSTLVVPPLAPKARQSQPDIIKPVGQVNPILSPLVLPEPKSAPKILPAEHNGIMTASAISPAFTPAEPPSPQVAPVIHVTIGRIEVRANVQTPSSKAKPSNRQPPMGLNEYLQRRGGGSS